MLPWTDNPEVAYPSEHRRIRGAEDMLASIDATPLEQGETWFTFEAQLGHAMLRGEIDAVTAIQALCDYEMWLNAGEPKMTTLPTESFIFK